MNLLELKQKLSEVGFSDEVAAKLNEIVDAAIAKGSLDAAVKQQMMDLVGLDIESGLLEADTMEKMALALNSLADDTKNAAQVADEAEARIEAEVNEKVGKVEDATKLGQIRGQAPPVAPTM